MNPVPATNRTDDEVARLQGDVATNRATSGQHFGLACPAWPVRELAGKDEHVLVEDNVRRGLAERQGSRRRDKRVVVLPDDLQQEALQVFALFLIRPAIGEDAI